jgi:hypothetical protein
MPLTYAGQRITATHLSLDYAQADTSATTVTAITTTQLSSSYTVPAGDALTGTCYRITAFGTGTWPNPVTTLDLGLSFAGTNAGGNLNISGSAFSAGITFRWHATGLVIIATTGASGTYKNDIDVRINQFTTLTPSVALAYAVSSTGTNAVDTTAANSLYITAIWGASNGGSITCNGTVFEKLGG